MPKRPERIIIANVEANILLKNIEVAKKLLPFFLEPKSLSEAAKELNVEPNSLYYWVKKFLKLDVLVITHKKQRAGSSIVYYATTAKTLILQADVGMCSIRDYFGQAISEYNEVIREGIVESMANLDENIGIIITNNGRGALQTKVAIITKDDATPIRQKLLEPDSPAAFTAWNHLRLNHKDAKELQQKLSRLLLEYQGKSRPRRSGYYFQLAIVPEPKNFNS